MTINLPAIYISIIIRRSFQHNPSSMIQARYLLQDLLWTQTTNFLHRKKFSTGPCVRLLCYKACLYHPTWWESKRFLELPSKSESEEKVANNTSKKAAKVMTGGMQEEKRQSGFTYSHGQEEEEETLPQLAILDKDPLVK